MSKRNILKILIIFVFSLFVILPTMEQFALSQESAVGGMTLLLKSQNKGDDDNSDDLSDVTEESVEVKVDTSSRCGPEAILPVEVCEIAQGLLCLNTPPFSVADKYVVVKGTVDRRTSVFSHIQVYSQQEYTKSFNQVEIEQWASSDCWEEGWLGTSDACLDQKGLFAIRVPLSEMGPYTIMVDVVSLDGEATSKTVRTSRVEPPKMTRDDITLEPDPAATGGVIEARKVIAHVDLLHGCKFCDFIGTATGGVMITIENMIESLDGGTKTIVRQGNIAAGGVFDICVPVLDGKNDLRITACNAATESSSCPEVGSVSFDVISNDAAIDVMLPDRSLYVSRDYPTIPLKFSVANLGGQTNECKDGDVVVYWNRLDPVSICPESDGYYYAQLTPTTGINAGKIDVNTGMETISKSFVFGWGKLVNPYIDPLSGWIQDGVGLQLGSEYVNEMLRPLINSFLNSDGLTEMVTDLMSTVPVIAGEEQETSEKNKPDPLIPILEELPYCDAGGGLE